MIFLLGGSIFGCSDPLEPKAPSWDVELTLPLVNRKYTLAELVARDTSLLRVGTDNQIFFTSSSDIPATVIGTSITLDVPDTSSQVELGPLGISSFSATAGISFPWLPGGSTTTIPDTTVQIAGLQNPIGGFLSLTIEEGTLTLSLRNNLPVPITVLSPLQLLDGQGRTLAIVTLNPATIPPLGVGVGSDNLAGRTTDNSITIGSFNLHIQGSPSPVPIPSGDLFVFTMQGSGLLVRRAELAFIPAQTLIANDTASLSIADSTLVRVAVFSSGDIQLGFTNSVNLDLVFSYQLPQLQQMAGGQFIGFRDSIFLPAFGSGTVTLPMAGRRMQSQNGDLIRSLEVYGSVRIPTGSTTPVTINDTDKISISLSSMSPIVIDSVEGVVKPTWISVQHFTPLDLGDFRRQFSGMISIPSASLDIDAITSSGFPVDLFVSIGAAIDSFGTMAWISIPPGERRVNPGGNSISLDPSQVGQFLTQISQSFPESLLVVGNILVNPPDVYSPTLSGVGSVGPSSGFRGLIDLDLPLIVGVTSGVVKDTVAFGDSDGDGETDFEVDRSTFDRLNYGRVFFELTNGLPVEVRFRMHFLDQSLIRLLSVPQGGEINAASALVDAQGFVTLPSNVRAIIELNQDEVSKFRPSEFMGFEYSLVTAANGSIVRFRTIDSVRTRVWTTISLKANQ